MTAVFEEICARIRRMKTKEEHIVTLVETKKAIINQVNKSKQEIQREAKKLYNEIQLKTFEIVKPISEEFTAIKRKQISREIKQIILKPQVCTLFSLNAMSIRPNTEDQKTIESTYIIKDDKKAKMTCITNDKNSMKLYNKIKTAIPTSIKKKSIKPVFTMSTNRIVYNEEKKLKKVGQQLFKNVKWLPTIQLKNDYIVNKIPITIANSINEKNTIQKYCGWDTNREYHNYGVIKLADNRAVKYKPSNSEIQQKEDYIEKLNRRIEGARHLTSYYQSQYELAVAGMKSLNQMMNYNEELDKKTEMKQEKIKELNKITEQNIKNNRAKVNKIKNEIKDLTKKRKKEVKEYQDAKSARISERKRANNIRNKTKALYGSNHYN
jgi:hypothetical protein